MGSKAPTPDYVLEMRAALAQNVRVHMNLMYSQIPAETNKAIALGKAAGVGKNTVIRILNEADHDVGADKLAKLAFHFNTTIGELTSYHGHKRKAVKVITDGEPTGRALKGALQR